VFCVEQGRWAQQTRYFGVEKEMAHGALRQELNAPQVSQSKVWSEVARTAEALAPGQRNETRYLGRIYEDKSVRREVDDYSRAITWTQDANGMAVMINGRVVGVEIFGDSGTFEKLRDKLLRSYAVDAVEFSGVEKSSAPRETVERFLRNARMTHLTPKTTIGIGRSFAIGGLSIYGSMLTWDEQIGAHGVVHASLFSDSRVTEQPPVVPMPMPRPLPRYRY
jgi:ARG and Rhodanese-Phosphatase-superfamily-associated Protein domain